jgi:hypothetical protein
MNQKDIRKFIAIVPAVRATAATTYNGEATVGDADGIPLKDADLVIVDVSVGAVAATGSLAFQLQVSNLATGNTTSTLVDVEDATLAVAADGDNKTYAISVKASNLPAISGDVYLYVKRVQTGAVDICDSTAILLTDHETKSVLYNGGTSDFSAEL